MKDYNEITNNLLQRRDRYVAEKKKRNKRIAGIIMPVVGVSLVSLGIMGAIKGDDIKNDVQVIVSEIASDTVADTTDTHDTSKPYNKETTKTNGNKNNNNINNNTAEVETAMQQGEADNYGSEGVRPGVIDKNHSNNKDFEQNLTQAETENPDANKWIKEIVVTQMPLKTTYYLGEELDLRGLEVTGYFHNGDVEDITPYIQIYNTKATYVSDKFGIFIEYTDNSDAINLAYTYCYVTVLPAPDETQTQATTTEASTDIIVTE